MVAAPVSKDSAPLNKEGTPVASKESPPNLVSDSVSDSNSQSAECSSSYSTDSEFSSDSTSGTEHTQDYSNISFESESDFSSQLQSSYGTRHAISIPTKSGSLSAQYKAISLEAKDQILGSTRSRSKKLKV